MQEDGLVNTAVSFGPRTFGLGLEKYFLRDRVHTFGIGSETCFLRFGLEKVFAFELTLSRSDFGLELEKCFLRMLT